MRIKKKELRKREAQLPINYPAPTVANPFDYESEKHRVENLCKRLAHNEVEIRDAVLAELPRYLKEISIKAAANATADPNVLKELENVMMKLSLGIFYCFWHSDKPLVQHECAFKISQLIFAPTTHGAKMIFIRCLFRILCREWCRIDHYRLDKYMALVRKLVFQMICFLYQLSVGDSVHPVTLKAEGNFISATEEAISTKKISSTTTATASDAVKRGAKGKGKSVASSKGVEATEVNVMDEASQFGNVFSSITALFQDDVLLNTTSVGLTLHICDLFFDELVRAKVSADLFVDLAKAIPLFAMSRGNYVEKRVLDNFFAPLTGGILEARWGEESADVIQAIYRKMIDVCRHYSVERGTVRSVRTMFTEAQLLLENKVTLATQPESVVEVRPRDVRRRIEREVDETNALRRQLAKELDGAKSLKRNEKREALKTFREAKTHGAEVNPRVAAIAKAAEARKKNREKTKSTKRKKIVKIRKSDL